MASTIKIKNSSTAGAVPSSGDLVQGELAINVTDRRIFTENASGTVVELGTPSIDDNGNATAITIDSSENVGIGTNSTTSKVRIESTGGAASSTFATTASRAALQITSESGSGLGTGTKLLSGIGGSSYAWLQVQNSNDNIAYDLAINPVGGNLLVGTTTASGQLAIGNKIGSNCISLQAVNQGGTYYFQEFKLGTGSAVGFINSNGTTTTYATSSDYRLKENVQPLTEALSVVAQLKPCTYTWKATGESTQGFIAHELQAVVPDAVSGEKDAVDADGNPVYQGIDTSFLVATLTAAIQELKATVDAQAARITTLEQA